MKTFLTFVAIPYLIVPLVYYVVYIFYCINANINPKELLEHSDSPRELFLFSWYTAPISIWILAFLLPITIVPAVMNKVYEWMFCDRKDR